MSLNKNIMRGNKVERIIKYYEITHSDFQNQISNTISRIKNQIEQNEQDRYLQLLDGLCCMRDIQNDNQVITGKILRIRMDLFPEILNTTENTLRDIEAGEDDGIVETVHFTLNSSRGVLGFEHNQYGVKANTFIDYLNKYKASDVGAFSLNPIIKDNLSTFNRRMQRCSSFYARVHKDNVGRLNDIDTGLFSAFSIAQQVGESEYVELTLKFDYRKRKSTSTISQRVQGLVNKLLKNRDDSDVFEVLQVKAEDTDKNLRLEVFDLLSDNERSRFRVSKRIKSRAVVSTEMFTLMIEDMQKKFN